MHLNHKKNTKTHCKVKKTPYLCTRVRKGTEINPPQSHTDNLSQA